jgi:hypothetical protein
MLSKILFLLWGQRVGLERRVGQRHLDTPAPHDSH